MFGGLSYGQDFKITDYKSTSKQVSITEDVLFKNYLNANPTTLDNVKYKSEIVILQLQDDNLQLIDVTLIDNEMCNHAYLIFDKSKKTYITLYMNIEETLIITYDSNFKEIYEINTGLGHTQFTAMKTPFTRCFDKIQDAVCDDGIGTIAWYTNPEIAIGAAIWCMLH